MSSNMVRTPFEEAHCAERCGQLAPSSANRRYRYALFDQHITERFDKSATSVEYELADF